MQKIWKTNRPSLPRYDMLKHWLKKFELKDDNDNASTESEDESVNT